MNTEVSCWRQLCLLAAGGAQPSGGLAALLQLPHDDQQWTPPDATQTAVLPFSTSRQHASHHVSQDVLQHVSHHASQHASLWKRLPVTGYSVESLSCLECGHRCILPQAATDTSVATVVQLFMCHLPPPHMGPCAAAFGYLCTSKQTLPALLLLLLLLFLLPSSLAFTVAGLKGRSVRLWCCHCHCCCGQAQALLCLYHLDSAWVPVCAATALQSY